MAAVKNLPENQILGLKTRLNDLSCPYTDGLDQLAVQSLLFEPNEGRLRILQWLFSSIDERLLDMVDAKHSASLVPGLLLAASSLCLCSPDDIDLIQGKCSVEDQYEFLEILIDMASSADLHHRNVTDTVRSTTIPDLVVRLESSGIAASQQYEQDHALLAALADSGQIHSLLQPALSYYQPDVRKMIDAQLKAAGKDVKKPPKPDMRTLIASAKDITERYDRLLEIQELIDREAPLSEEDESRTELLKQQLRLLVTELSQLHTSVTCLYDSHLRVWCRRQTAEFSQLGTTVHRLHKTLAGVCKIFEKMSDLRRIYCAINQRAERLNNTSIRPILEEIEHVGVSGLSDVKSVIGILDQALVRNRQL